MNTFFSLLSIQLAVLLATLKKKDKKKLRKAFESFGQSNVLKNFNYGMVYLLMALSIPYAGCTLLILITKGYDIYSSLALSSIFPLSTLHVVYRTHKLYEFKSVKRK